jgi:hypothetical protein
MSPSLLFEFAGSLFGMTLGVAETMGTGSN